MAGLGGDAFWQMTAGEYTRRLIAYRRQQEQTIEIERGRFFHTLNAVGVAWYGSEWKWIDGQEHERDETETQRQIAELRRILRPERADTTLRDGKP